MSESPTKVTEASFVLVEECQINAKFTFNYAVLCLNHLLYTVNACSSIKNQIIFCNIIHWSNTATLPSATGLPDGTNLYTVNTGAPQG